MSVNRFILEDLASRALGIAIPPYWHWQKNAAAERAEDYGGEENAEVRRAADFEEQVAQMGDTQLKEMIRQNALGYPMVMPLDIEVPGEKEMWTFPWEPLITLKGKNVITRRRVAKSLRRGTIKECWMQDDYEISIRGILMDGRDESRYPQEDVLKLRRICEARQGLAVECPLLKLFEITQIVVEDFDIPFTKGENVQGYSLKAYSDDLYDLLVDETHLKIE